MFMEIKIGNIYWITSKSDIAHPHVVIGIDKSNETLLVCSITTNKIKLEMPGNILLNIGEGNLKTKSIIEVSKISTIHKSQLNEYIGTLDNNRLDEIQNGIDFIERSFLRTNKD